MSLFYARPKEGQHVLHAPLEQELDHADRCLRLVTKYKRDARWVREKDTVIRQDATHFQRLG